MGGGVPGGAMASRDLLPNRWGKRAGSSFRDGDRAGNVGGRQGADVTRPAGYLDGRVALDGSDCVTPVALAFKSATACRGDAAAWYRTLNHVLSWASSSLHVIIEHTSSNQLHQVCLKTIKVGNSGIVALLKDDQS